MTSEEQTHYRPRKNEIIVAIIGAVAVLATAIISNLDKIRGDVVTAQVEGYQPSPDFENELKIYFINSGWSKLIENSQKEFLVALQKKLLEENPDRPQTVLAVMHAVNEEIIRVDDFIEAILPIYRKHYDLEQLHELNRFYSTKVMQKLGKEIPSIAKEFAPKQTNLLLNFQQRVQKRLDDSLPADGRVVLPQVCLYGVSAPP